MTEIITKSNFVVRDYGFSYLTDFRVIDKHEKQISCFNKANEGFLFDHIPLSLSTREELYLKYSVVVALFFSVLGSILTAINVLIAIFN
jgi:hypothetical protein